MPLWLLLEDEGLKDDRLHPPTDDSNQSSHHGCPSSIR